MGFYEKFCLVCLFQTLYTLYQTGKMTENLPETPFLVWHADCYSY